MTETEQTTDDTAPGLGDEDLAEDPEGDDDNLVVSISRGMGVVARTVSDGFQGVADVFRAAAARKPPPREIPEETMDDLLQQLGELVSSYAGDGYPALGEKPEFWRLIAKLRFARRRQVAELTGEARRRKRPRAEDAVLDPEPASNGSGKTSSAAAPEAIPVVEQRTPRNKPKAAEATPLPPAKEPSSDAGEPDETQS